LHLEQVLDDSLDLRVVKPRHFGNLGDGHDNHFDYLRVTRSLFLDHEVDQKVLNTYLFVDWDFKPVFGEQLLQG